MTNTNLLILIFEFHVFYKPYNQELSKIYNQTRIYCSTKITYTFYTECIINPTQIQRLTLRHITFPKEKVFLHTVYTLL